LFWRYVETRQICSKIGGCRRKMVANTQKRLGHFTWKCRQEKQRMLKSYFKISDGESSPCKARRQPFALAFVWTLSNPAPCQQKIPVGAVETGSVNRLMTRWLHRKSPFHRMHLGRACGIVPCPAESVLPSFRIQVERYPVRKCVGPFSRDLL
jgi:hypothetical protein